jgi:hypothetical protein
MQRSAWFGLAATLIFVASNTAHAQRLTVDLRPVLAVPTARLAGTDLEAGFGVGGTVALMVSSPFHVFAGWDWVHFNAEQSFAGSNMDFEETGYTMGARVELPFRNDGAVRYRFEAAATWKHIETENQAGDIVADSGHELGFEIAGGAIFPVGGQWTMVPALRFRALPSRFTLSSLTTVGNLRYVALEFGLSHRF